MSGNMQLSVSVFFFTEQWDGIGTNPDRLDADKLYLSHPGFLTAPEEQEQSWCPALTSLGVEIRWESPDALSGFGLCVKLLFQEGQGQTVKCSFRAISAHMHSPAILPSVFFREHVSIWQTLFFFFFFFGLANSSGRCGPSSFWEDAKRFRLDAGDAAATASL